MPKQYTLLGRPIPHFSNRRITLLLFGVSLIALTAISILPSSSSPDAHPSRKSSASKLRDSFSKNILHPFRQPAHPPPRQKNDTYAGSSWWADWKWLSVPFSSTLTLDEERTLLPPLRERPLIYCYYDETLKKKKEEKDAESDLLLTWRRAWWAQGFRPTIISASEAMNNPKYAELQQIEVGPELKEDLIRWLAWDTMGGGLLSQYTLLPMGSSEGPLLTYLRRGEYPQLTTWKGLDDGLIAGAKTEVSQAIRAIFDSGTLSRQETVVEALSKKLIKVDKASKSLAYYSPKIIKKYYFKVSETIANGRAKGLGALNRLMNSHLQTAWQNSHPEGIEVLKPLPDHTTTMIANALSLANTLASCPDTPMPSSCPPQLPRCRPCLAAAAASMKIRTPAHYRNSSRVFTIGTVPHPWTLALMHNLRETLDVAWIRRESPRDAWLAAVTQDLLGLKASGDRRVMRFKQAVAGELAAAHALWITAEAEMPNDLDWHFGFAVPKQPGEKQTEVHEGDEKTEEKKVEEETMRDDETHELTPEEALAQEPILLDRAKQVVALTKPTAKTRLRASLEAWNLADTEAWKFTRAFLARQSMEREQWEKDEARYSRGVGSEKGRNAWSRWGDSKENSASD